ncbi:MAG: hypothetical protein LBC68_05385, partial [Prevotellaceae bacterium]|nr:hypothetical protein [Prevotellaceae bacterium]
YFYNRKIRSTSIFQILQFSTLKSEKKELVLHRKSEHYIILFSNFALSQKRAKNRFSDTAYWY